jgi:hypothetical protein
MATQPYHPDQGSKPPCHALGSHPSVVIFRRRKLNSILYSRKKNAKTGKRRNLGTFKSLEKTKAHERAARCSKSEMERRSFHGPRIYCRRHPNSWRQNRRVGPMIRKLKSGEYRLYSRKKNPKTGKRRNLGTFRTLEKAKAHDGLSNTLNATKEKICRVKNSEALQERM